MYWNIRSSCLLKLGFNINLKKGTTTVIRITQNLKDCLPARLLQFGSAMFSIKSSHTNMLSVYYTATINGEGQTELIDVLQSNFKRIS
jgi:hypothetical protein